MNVRVEAPAKINLTLEVGAPRADGLHPLQSVVMFAAAGEWVEAAPANDLTLQIIGPFADRLAVDESNLVLRAARALAAQASVTRGAALTLHKALPVASGIGGGSSDAAAALKALNQLWGLGLDEAALARIAQTLGADVPVCVAARSAYMTGIGEVFAPLALPSLDAVLINPRTPLPTADVYRRFDSMRLGARFVSRATPGWRTRDEVVAGAAAIGNDLAAPARALSPPIAEIEAWLSRQPMVRHFALSGSGATLFALVENEDEAGQLSGNATRDLPACWAKAVRLGDALDATAPSA